MPVSVVLNDTDDKWGAIQLASITDTDGMLHVTAKPHATEEGNTAVQVAMRVAVVTGQEEESGTPNVIFVMASCVVTMREFVAAANALANSPHTREPLPGAPDPDAAA